MNKNIFAFLLSILVFLFLNNIWMHRAKKLPMDNDEFYSQVANIEQASFAKIFLGNIEEGNNTPLFYGVQKLYQRIKGYKTPDLWLKGQWGYNHPASQITLRRPSVLYMSAGIAILFFYVVCRFGYFMGAYTLIISLLSYMVWAYAVIARPYALWFLLTNLQMVLLLCWVEAKHPKHPKWKISFAITNMLLALTVFFSVISSIAVAVVMWVQGKRKIQDYYFTLMLPIAISVFYFMKSPKYQFWFNGSPVKLLAANLPIDRGLTILLGVGLCYVALKLKEKHWFNNITKSQLDYVKALMLYVGVVLAGCIAILIKLKMGESTSHEGFEVSNRYFMFLTPLGIMATVVMSYYLVTLPKGIFKKAAWIILLSLLFYRCVKILIFVLNG